MANSVDPDQTAPIGTYLLFSLPSIETHEKLH